MKNLSFTSAWSGKSFFTKGETAVIEVETHLYYQIFKNILTIIGGKKLLLADNVATFAIQSLEFKVEEFPTCKMGNSLFFLHHQQ
ncbi:MAG: hypothetical protein LBB79_00600 [Prevotellaceae bacterium]|jgi:hypothetical protein|nr:hypothetical protein [Prevotellaceae bacterium]